MATVLEPEVATVNLSLTDQVFDAALRSAGSAGDDARDMARRSLIDWFACTIGGASEPLVEKLVASTTAVAAAGPFPLVGRGERMGLFDMALINGAAGHALDYDDGHAAMVGHPSAPTIPALLAAAALSGAGGAALIEAIILSFDVAARIGLLLSPDHYRRGFHGTATAGAVAAAAGCAHLMGLDPMARASAMGLAGTRAAGLKASFGTEAKPLHAGWAALVGISAAHWAKHGLIGAADIVGHPTGLRSMSETFNPEPAAADAPPWILETTYKHHAACYGTHSTLEAVLRMMREDGVTGAEVEEVVIDIDRDRDTVCNLQVVETGLAAKFSLRMVTAMVLAEVNTANPASFSDEVVHRPEVRRLFARVRVELHDQGFANSRVTLRTRDGRELRAVGEAKMLAGAEADRATGAKFAGLAAPVLGEERAGALKAALDAIASRGEIGSLLELAVPAGLA